MAAGVRRPGTRAALTWLAWLVVAPLVLLAAARLLHLSDRWAPLFALETLSPVLYLPAYLVVGSAALLRRRALAGVALVVVAAHVAWTAPDVRWWPRPQPDATGPTVEVVAANVLAANGRGGDAVRRLLALDADVLVVVELTTPVADALGAGYPHVFVRPDDTGNFGSGIFSRHPLGETEAFGLQGYPMVRATLDVDGSQTTVVAVHTLQPLAGLPVLRRQLDDVGRLVRDIDRPVVVAGDFNATRQHRGFRSLLDTGLRDAHLERGRGVARTWPAHLPVPAFALLDHVLVSDGIAVDDVGVLEVPGSDHRAVRARLRLPVREASGRR